MWDTQPSYENGFPGSNIYVAFTESWRQGTLSSINLIATVFCARGGKQQKCSIQKDCYNRLLLAWSISFLGSKAIEPATLKTLKGTKSVYLFTINSTYKFISAVDIKLPFLAVNYTYLKNLKIFRFTQFLEEKAMWASGHSMNLCFLHTCHNFNSIISFDN